MGSKRLVLDQVKEYIHNEGCEYISHSGHLSTGQTTIRCRCGHTTTCAFKDFKRGMYRFCRNCAHIESGIKGRVPYEEIRGRIEKEGCELLSNKQDYVGQRGDVTIRGKCGHIYKTNLKRFLQGKNHICRQCEGEQHGAYKLLSYAFVKKVFEDNGCHLLEKTYRGNAHKLEYICRCGHKSHITYNSFQYGYGRLCPLCAKKLMSQAQTEEAIREFLMDDNIQHEYRIKAEGKSLSVDIYSKEFRIVVEYNGPHHYSPDQFRKDIGRDIEQQKQRDKAIRNWCSDSNITYVEIDGREWYKRRTTIPEYKRIIGLCLRVIEVIRKKGTRIDYICLPRYKDTRFLLSYEDRYGAESLLSLTGLLENLFAINNREKRIVYNT